MQKTIKITGKGHIKVSPDIMRLNLEIQEVYKDYEETLKMSSEYTETLRNVIQTLGFKRKDLKTTAFNIDLVYENYQEDGVYKEKIQGYKFSHKMKLEFEKDNRLLGKLLYAFAHSSVTPKLSLDYTISDPDCVKNELLKKAVEDAKKKAEIIAQTSGVKLWEIVNVDYSWEESSFSERTVSTYEIRCCEGDYSLNIENDDIDMEEAVTVVWSIL